MKIEADGVDELLERLADMPRRLEKQIVTPALEKAGALIMDETITNLRRHRRTGRLEESITLSKPVRGRNGADWHIKVMAGGSKGHHAHLLEYGHGGPKPAPPYPFMRPAYEAKRREAQDVIINDIKKGIGL